MVELAIRMRKLDSHTSESQRLQQGVEAKVKQKVAAVSPRYPLRRAYFRGGVSTRVAERKSTMRSKGLDREDGLRHQEAERFSLLTGKVRQPASLTGTECTSALTRKKNKTSARCLPGVHCTVQR